MFLQNKENYPYYPFLSGALGHTCNFMKKLIQIIMELSTTVLIFSSVIYTHFFLISHFV